MRAGDLCSLPHRLEVGDFSLCGSALEADFRSQPAILEEVHPRAPKGYRMLGRESLVWRSMNEADLGYRPYAFGRPSQARL